MRDYKKVAIAGVLTMSILIGHSDVTASSVKKPYYKTNVNTDYLVEDADLYEETGEVVTFEAKYSFARMLGDHHVYNVYNSSVDGKKEQSLTGYIMCGGGEYGISFGVLDNTNSVKKIVLDGKKTFKLNSSRKWNTKDDMWREFDDRSSKDLKLVCKTATKLKVPNGKHTLTITDKHGHKSVLKVWKDTKKPKIKVFKKGGKRYCKITDNAGIYEVDGKKISKNGKIVKSYTTVAKKGYYVCTASDIAGNSSDVSW